VGSTSQETLPNALRVKSRLVFAAYRVGLLLSIAQIGVYVVSSAKIIADHRVHVRKA
jgi:hypothetical protein